MSTWLSTIRVSLIVTSGYAATAIAPPRPYNNCGCTRLPVNVELAILTATGCVRAPAQFSVIATAPPASAMPVTVPESGLAMLLTNCELVIDSICPGYCTVTWMPPPILAALPANVTESRTRLCAVLIAPPPLSVFWYAF